MRSNLLYFFGRGSTLRLLGAVVLSSLCLRSAFAQVSVLTQRNDNRRSGLNLSETQLTTSSVAPSTFGKLFSRGIDGPNSQQPLIYSNLSIGGKFRNAVFICTGKNLYAFDADDATQSAPLWSRKLGPYGVIPEVYSTPVIDPVSKTIYVCGRLADGDKLLQSSWHERIWAIDLLTGTDKIPSVDITATIPGTGNDNNGDGTLSFNPRVHANRPGLLLANGNLYIACSAIMDSGPYHGWLFSYNAQTLQQTGAYCTSPNKAWVGLWMSANGLVADESGNVYAVSANAQNTVQTELLANAVLKFAPTFPLTLVDYFMPSNVSYLNRYNLDLGVSGVLLTPDGKLITGSKQGKIYVLDHNNLGGFGTSDNIIQSFQGANKHTHGNPVVYDGPSGKLLYIWGEEDFLKAFLEGSNGQYTSPAVAQSPAMAPHGMPGGILSVSANGKVPGSAIVWASVPAIGTALGYLIPGTLHAYDASNLHEIWSTGWDYVEKVGTLAKYVPPTVANGRVYVPTVSGMLSVYGLLSSSVPQAPVRVIAEGTASGIHLYWNSTPNTSSYSVKRSLSSSSGFATLVSGLSTTSYADTTAVMGKLYYYQVVSSNAQGPGVPAPVASAWVVANAPMTVTNDGVADGPQCNGGATTSGSVLNLTNLAGNSFGSAFWAKVGAIRTFNTSFTVRSQGDVQGFTLTVQGSAKTAIGAGGPMIGYGPDDVTAKSVRSSVAIAFLAKAPNGLTISKSGVVLDGEPPTSVSTDLALGGINLNSGNPLLVNLRYDGVILTVTVTDQTTMATTSYTKAVNIPSVVGSTKGFVGFTGSTGVLGGSIQISSWTYAMND